jgi:NADPH:quinone reductase-like Zn-dependent oxidoreductase
MSRQQKASFLPSKFADNFVLGTAPIYKPSPGELLVKNKAASLNPVDWKVQKYGMFVEHYPAIVGVDIAGDVEEVGEGITSFSKGNRVYVAFF